MESEARILAFVAGGVSLGYRSEPSGLPGGPGREPGVFSAKSVANMQTDADCRIVQKSLCNGWQKYSQIRERRTLPEIGQND